MNDSTSDNILSFWNSRAGLGQWAGSRDVLAKQLEMEVLAAQVRDGMRILEVGCGNGITAIEIARRHVVQITAIDFAAEMIAAAKDLLVGQDLRGTINFNVGDVREMKRLTQRFDLIYTERVLINLPDWSVQLQALSDITALLEPGGVYAMCENSQEGLDRINQFRRRVGLSAIQPPWHNRYLRETEIARVDLPGLQLQSVEAYSSTYYFLSRVVNAWLAMREGKEPVYEAPINQLALQLPPIGDFGQGKLWLWRKMK